MGIVVPALPRPDEEGEGKPAELLPDLPALPPELPDEPLELPALPPEEGGEDVGEGIEVEEDWLAQPPIRNAQTVPSAVA